MSNQNKWDVTQMADQTGRVAIVTGANSGIGFETAKQLAKKGATVVMACRNQAKGETAADAIRSEEPAGSVQVMALDLSSLASVRAFAAEFSSQFDRLDLLINNAGVMALPKRFETVDGFEMQFGTNHLGHFALTGLLFDLLVKTPESRVVNVSSGAHRAGRMAWDDLQSQRSYSPFVAYSQSKLANLLFTNELQRRLDRAGVKTLATAAHPGWTATNLQTHSGLAGLLNPFFGQKPPMGALPTLYAATEPSVVPMGYYGPDGLMEMRGYPKPVGTSGSAQDQAAAARLWDLSEALTGVAFLSETAPHTEPITA
jgi:NAD(P)-dependent dehydrogenase (short-subunit alcohol dehydrogenase family)